MITPSFGLTATERVLPRLALDFTTASLDPRVAVTRALNTATRTTETGAVEIVNANLPRFDYASGVCRGLLIEETRANLLINSVFAGAVAGTPGTAPTSWTDFVSTGTITSVASGIYAAGNAIRIANTGTRRAFYRTQAVSANTTYTYNVTITVNSTPVAGYPRILDCMNIVSGLAGSTITYQLNGAAATSTTTIPNGQTSKVTAILAVAAAAGNVEVRWGLGISGAIDGDVTIQMPQFEAGAFATSYIPTTTTSLTRNADAVSMTGTNFSSWYNATEGAMFFEGSTFVDQGSTTVSFAEVSNGVSTSVTMTLGMFAASAALFAVVNTTTQANINLGAFSLNTVLRLTGAYKANSFAAAKNGNTTLTDTSGSIPAVSQLIIGQRLGGLYMNGHARKFFYWPQRLTDVEVQAFSK
jgi:hypothetical protein